jgi:Peptidase family M1 domain
MPGRIVAAGQPGESWMSSASKKIFAMTRRGIWRRLSAAVLFALTALSAFAHGAPHNAKLRVSMPSASLQAAGGAATANALAHGEATRATLSTRVVAYKIDAKLDTTAHTITATESLTYHNLTGQPQQDFPFHLYLNAFQPQSTWISETRIDNPNYEWKAENFGSIRVSSIEAVGMGDVTGTMRFIQPDDTNAEDHTVMQVRLPKAVAPGADVEFKISFVDQMPKVVARTGYVHDFYMVGQWFPKVGVWWKGAWNCHQFHRNTEFFADFGTFDVTITLPKNEIVGAGGDVVSDTENADGTRTLVFHSEDVHDFSWAASPSFTVVEDSWTGSAGTVKIHLLMSPGNMRTVPRYIHAVKGTLQKFDEWYGPYPYDRITMVDPPHGGFRAGGMEYPTLITLDTDWYMPKKVLEPEIVAVHEFGHQYWYGMVATNEFEDAWLDEGINSYTEVKIMDALYGQHRDALNLPYGTMSERELQRVMYLVEPDTDPITRHAWQFLDDSAYGGITYGKTACALLTLEKIIGEDTLRRALHTYFMRYRFTHPTGEDFLKTIEEVSGQNLRWYFDQAIYGTAILDYEVMNLHSDPLPWYPTDGNHGGIGANGFRNYVVVHRKGDFIMPVDLQVRFRNGEMVMEHWDGRDRWIRYTYDRPDKIVSAEIDPTHQVLLDRDEFNNSWTTEGSGKAVRKLTNLCTFFDQWIGQILAWLT